MQINALPMYEAVYFDKLTFVILFLIIFIYILLKLPTLKNPSYRENQNFKLSQYTKNKKTNAY